MTALKEFSNYANRPLEEYERRQSANFTQIIKIINSPKNEDKEYELSFYAFLSQHPDSYMKIIIESLEPNYILLFMHDLAARDTDNVLRCLVPKSLAIKYGLQESKNVYIEVDMFCKKKLKYKSTSYDLPWVDSVILLNDFKISSPLKQRLLSKTESKNANKLREEILFGCLDEVEVSNVKFSIFNSIFLSPKVNSKSGIESKTFIDNSTNWKFLINMDNYNQLVNAMIPPEVNNSHFPFLRGDSMHKHLDRYGEEFTINAYYPITEHQKIYFNASCDTNRAEDPNLFLRSLGSSDLGITHQTKYRNYRVKKDIIDKMINSEFYFNENYLPKYRIQSLTKSFKLLQENQKLLYTDYAERIFNTPIKLSSPSASEKDRAHKLAEEYCMQIRYDIKNNGDSYVNSIARSILENIRRIKAVMQRSSLKYDEFTGIQYMEDLNTNFGDIIESKDYARLGRLPLDPEHIRKIMKNPICADIIAGLKNRNRIANYDELIGEVMNSGALHELPDILKEFNKLIEWNTISKIGNVVRLIDSQF